MSILSSRRPGVADLLTLGNALCGTTAMLVMSGVESRRVWDADDRFRIAALLLVCGTVLDVFDGAAARRWGSTPLGGPLDSLSDAITFGVAPVVAVTVYCAPGSSPPERIILAIGGLVYVAAALVRLADFVAVRRDKVDFVGLPTTSAAVAAIAMCFLSPPPLLAAAGLVGIAALMVSPLAYPTGARLMVVCLVGWGVGLLGILEVVDIRVPAAVTIIIIVVVVPLVTHLLARAVTERISA